MLTIVKTALIATAALAAAACSKQDPAASAAEDVNATVEELQSEAADVNEAAQDVNAAAAAMEPEAGDDTRTGGDTR